MDIFGVLTLIGGLALFLYGMKVMGDSLLMLSGGKLEKVLEKLTQNRLKALLLGALVTAVIQSSSATTVMVVGFVNSGIMRLGQAVGVIMGANIGTTVTSWILSLAGLRNGNLFIQLLKPSSFSPLLAAAGIILLMTGEEGTKKKSVGNILIGFAVLMFGMETMSGAVSPLRDNEGFTRMLTTFSNPILGMAAGAILTAIIQSSSASVGILQALCMTGAVSFGSAIPIIMGQNIGTCVTALISSIGAAKNAKRAAFIHLYFNLIGTILFMTVFYTVDAFVHFPFLEGRVGAMGIAVTHSMFNILCAIVLFPFAGGLVKLASLTVRGKAEEKKKGEERPAVLNALDERFLDRPSFAMRLCKNAADEMGTHCRDAIFLATQVLDEYSEEKIREVIRLEQLVDRFEDALGSYLVKLAGRDLSREDSRLLSILLHSINDFERISDHAINITDSAVKMKENRIALTDQGQQELSCIRAAVHDIMNMTLSVFLEENVEGAANVEPLEEVINGLVAQVKQRHIQRLRSGICSMDAGLILGDILNNYERVSDHCSNIAAALIEIQSDALDVHEYLNVRIKGSDPHFREEYVRLKDIYILP